ncbi:unnamed protein product [Mytilus coruscus]|uniref:Uncharacterized protein n=1 Tax=Mytilus coruscus TaxID=42192 RepID=A0A6J8B896_MYTCO|nr:unnamed protein product [Mytilus coruscus]
MNKEKIINRLKELNEDNTEGNTEFLRNKLKTIERTRQIKVWHDHSCILNHTYINFMINYVYDNANFLTDEEFQKQNPTLSRIDCQKIVEKPQLYILGQSDLTQLPTTESSNKNSIMGSDELVTSNIETNNDLTPLATSQFSNDDCIMESVEPETIEANYDLTPLAISQFSNDNCIMESVEPEADNIEVNYEQNKSPTNQESHKSVITLSAEFHHAFDDDSGTLRDTQIVSCSGDHDNHFASDTLPKGFEGLNERMEPPEQPSLVNVHQSCPLSNNRPTKEPIRRPIRRPKPDEQLLKATRVSQMEKQSKSSLNEQTMAKPLCSRARRQLLFEEKSNLANQNLTDENDPFKLRRIQTNKANSTDQGIVVHFSSCQIKMC